MHRASGEHLDLKLNWYRSKKPGAYAPGIFIIYIFNNLSLYFLCTFYRSLSDFFVDNPLIERYNIITEGENTERKYRRK